MEDYRQEVSAVLSTSTFAETAALVGDPARANMLATLMDGRARTAAELADSAGIMPQTASGHLVKLVESGLLTMERQGRHRYHRLASVTVAQMLESIMSVAANVGRSTANGKRQVRHIGPRDKRLRRARTCYDHLAGEIAVAITDRLVERRHIELSADGGALTPEGASFLRNLGVDIEAAEARASSRGSGRMFCRPCLDWSERRHHIAGAVGAALCQFCFNQNLVRRIDGTRALEITPAGHLALGKAFEVHLWQQDTT